MQFIYGLTNLNEFAAQAYTMGTFEGVEETRLSGYSQMGQYEALANSNLLHTHGLSKWYNLVFQALKKIVKTILGLNESNTVWADVMYSQLLVDRSNFVIIEGSEADMNVSYNKIGNDILKNCR